MTDPPPEKTPPMEPEGALMEALGMRTNDAQDQPEPELPEPASDPSDEDASIGMEVVPGLDTLHGVSSKDSLTQKKQQTRDNNNSDTELEALAELVPDVKARRRRTNDSGTDRSFEQDVLTAAAQHAVDMRVEDEMKAAMDEQDDDEKQQQQRRQSTGNDSVAARRLSVEHAAPAAAAAVGRTDSMHVQRSQEEPVVDYTAQRESASSGAREIENDPGDDSTLDGYPGSEGALEDGAALDENKISKEFIATNPMDSQQSISTATQTHEVRMPMYLPTFKPATGCTNASDFIVRCFVARLRAGITVVKHGRSRWCKSRLRVLHIHPDGRSLSWKPAEGEPATSKRPPKLDLSQCQEVRHAWSPDPGNPMYTGTPILRQKCEAANAHKSFALIFKQRTVDITAVTADQCKVLMEGFSALCFRLQVANLAGRGGAPKNNNKNAARPMPEEDGVSVTASNTLTNTSTPRGR